MYLIIHMSLEMLQKLMIYLSTKKTWTNTEKWRKRKRPYFYYNLIILGIDDKSVTNIILTTWTLGNTLLENRLKRILRGGKKIKNYWESNENNNSLPNLWDMTKCIQWKIKCHQYQHRKTKIKRPIYSI